MKKVEGVGVRSNRVNKRFQCEKSMMKNWLTLGQGE